MVTLVLLSTKRVWHFTFTSFDKRNLVNVSDPGLRREKWKTRCEDGHFITDKQCHISLELNTSLLSG